MDGTKQGRTLSDSQLDCEIASAVGIEPSPEFLARVRTRLASEPEGSRWRLGVVEPVWGVAIVGIVLALVVPEWTRDNTPAPSAAAKNTVAAPVTTNAEARGRSSRSVPSTALPRSLARRVAPVETPLRLSPVLFSDDERKALLTLVQAVEEGRVPPLPTATQAAERSDGLRELRIEPLVIEPLPQLARLELGASQ